MGELTTKNMEDYQLLIDERFKSLEIAKKLEAKEIERRLRLLNGEANQLKDMQAKYIPREIFDRELSGLKSQLTLINEWKIRQEGKYGGQGQSMQLILWLLTIVSLTFGIVSWLR